MNKQQPPLYKDTWRKEPTPLDEFVQYRLTPTPLLGNSQCPAVQYTFTISTDGGTDWHNPTDQDGQDLLQAVLDTGICCQSAGENCWARRQTQAN